MDVSGFAGAGRLPGNGEKTEHRERQPRNAPSLGGTGALR